MSVYTMLCAKTPSAWDPTFCDFQSQALTPHFVHTEDAEQRLMMDYVDVEENFHPVASGMLSPAIQTPNPEPAAVLFWKCFLSCQGRRSTGGSLRVALA